MPNIKGISTDKDGNVSITQVDASKYDLARTDLAKSTEDDKGVSIKSKPDFDVYTHCYENVTMKNTKRTAILVCNKGIVPRKEWWIIPTIQKGIIK